ncbi:MAG: IMP dehydrogenase [Chloroflexota bacterium]|nr:IMP dehydrogenase [Chloroflexota bacterium]
MICINTAQHEPCVANQSITAAASTWPTTTPGSSRMSSDPTPNRGPSAGLIGHLIGGLCRSLGYVGACDIHEMQTWVRFVQVTEAGADEDSPHDIVLVSESPSDQHRTQ